MKKLFWAFLFVIILTMPRLVFANEANGIITLDLTPDISIQEVAVARSMYVQVARIENETERIIWESIVDTLKDINITVPDGKYKIYVQLEDHRTIWELDNNDEYFTVSPTNNTVVSLWANEPYLKEVFADAPWRVEIQHIPIIVMIKDADQTAGDYDLGDVEIYWDTDCDYDNDEKDDRLLKTETIWNPTTVDENNYNLYFPGDWYGITDLSRSGRDKQGNFYTLSGETCLHVVIRDIGGFWDLDRDTKSHFKVNVVEGHSIPKLADWYSGDVHYHSYYTDNNVEFGFPVKATINAAFAIGLDWVTLTDHSFDLDSYMPGHNEEGKWSLIKEDCKDISQGGYSLPSIKCIPAEEVSSRNANDRFVHLLAYGISNYIEGEGADGLIWPLPNEDNINIDPDEWDDYPLTRDLGVQTYEPNYEDVLTQINNQGGFAYGSHPTYPPGQSDLLHRGTWQDADFELIFDSDPNNDYVGLEVWNTLDDPASRDEGLSKWTSLLRKGLSYSPFKKIFISGGSDAHGDFSHTTKWSSWMKIPYIGDNDNAFGKIRTAVFVPGYSQSNVPPQEKILDALRNGHSIMTDGPMVSFMIKDKIIGDTLSIQEGDSATLHVDWKSTPEFGSFNYITIREGTNNGDAFYWSVALNDQNNLESSYDLTISPIENSYYRISAGTDKGHEAYTNPIWVEVEGAEPPPPPCPASDGLSSQQACPADTTPPSIYNTYTTPPSPIEGEAVDVYSTVIDDTEVANVILKYTVDGTVWNQITMTKETGDTYKTASAIPGQTAGTLLQYRVYAEDTSTNGAETAIFSITTGCTDTSPPDTPSLYPLASPDSDGSYTVDWTDTVDAGCSGLRGYELWESQNPSFPSLETIKYHPTSSQQSIMGRSTGTYYYRARAVDKADNPSGWSNTAEVTVSLGGTPGDTAPPAITTFYPLQGQLCKSGTGSPINTLIYATATDTSTGGSNIAGGTLYYQPPGGSWTSTAMTPQDGSLDSSFEKLYTGIGPFTATGAVNYYATTLDAAGNTGYKGSQSQPYTLSVVDCTPPPEGAVEDFSNEVGKTATVKNTWWGDWKYYENPETGTNYVTGLAGYEGRDNVGLFIWPGNAEDQVIYKYPYHWNFADQYGSWRIWVNNEGNYKEDVRLYFYDYNDKAAYTEWNEVQADGNWIQLEWKRHRDLDSEESGFNWGDVKYVELKIDKLVSGTSREFYFDDLEWTGETITKGNAYFTSTPSGAEIWIDDVYTGKTTPATVFNIEEGQHYFILKKDGFTDYLGEFTVIAGQKTDAPEATLSDAVPPVVAITTPQEGASVGTDTVPVTWSGFDLGVDIDHYEVQLDDLAPINKGTSTSHTYSGLSEGSHTIYVWAYDKDSNEALDSISFLVDTTPPPNPSPVASPGGWTNLQYVLISWTQVYDASSVSRYEYQVDSTSGEWTDNGKDTTFVTPAMPTGQHTIYVRGVDGAENIGGAGEVNVNVDADNPTGSIIINNGDPYTGNQTIALSVTYDDEGSGVAHVRYSADGVWDDEPWETPTKTRTWNITPGDGEKQVYYQVRDHVGRTSGTYSDTIVLDTTAPMIQSVWHEPETPTVNDPVTVYATIFDHSDLDVVLQYSTDESATWLEKKMTTGTAQTMVLGEYGGSKKKREKNGKKRYIVKYKPGKEPSKKDIEKAKGKQIGKIKKLNVKIIETDAPGRFVKEMKKNKGIIYVEEAQILQAESTPTDELYPEQWSLERIHASQGWTLATGEGVTAAVLDTGIDYTHPDLDDNYLGGYDWVNGDNDPMDDNGHGTYVAGIIAAEQNGLGIIGVSPGAKLRAYKVLDKYGLGYDYHVAEAIIEAADKGVDIISMSLGGGYSRVLEEAAEYAANKDILLVAAAGNNKGRVLYPAAFDTVIAVSSTDIDNTLSSFSSFGPEVELTAPGGGVESVLSTDLGGGYAGRSGTSASAAHVTGVAALAKELHTEWKSREIRNLLHSSVVDLGTPGRDDFYGYGLIDAARIGASEPPVEQPPNPPSSEGESPSMALTTRTYRATIGQLPSPAIYRVVATDQVGLVKEDDNEGQYYKIPTSPSPITISSPVNKTYSSDSVPLIYSVGKPTTWEAYSLDDKENKTTGGVLTTFSDGSSTKEIHFSSQGLSEEVYIRLPKNSSVVGRPRLTLKGRNIVTPVIQSEPTEYTTTSDNYVLVKEFRFDSKKDYRYIIDTVKQGIFVDYEEATAIGKITYQIGGGDEITAFEDIIGGSTPADFLHSVSWETGYDEEIVIRYYLKAGPPESQLGSLTSLTFPDLGSFGGKDHSIRPIDNNVDPDGIYANSRYDLYVESLPNIRIHAQANEEGVRGENYLTWTFTLYDSGVQKGRVVLRIFSTTGFECSGNTIRNIYWPMSWKERSDGNLYVKAYNFYCSTNGGSGYFVFSGKIGFNAVTTGKASLSSNPSGADIWIDNHDTYSNTPSTIGDLAEGQYTYTLKLEGYADYQGIFQVTAGQTTTVPTANLIPLPGSASFSSSPSGASIWIDGSDTGATTSSTIENLAAGTHTFTLKKSGYKDHHRSFTVYGGETTTVPTTILIPITTHMKGLETSGYSISTYPTNVYVDVGSDSSKESEIPGALLSIEYEVTLDPDAINDYLASHDADETGYVDVPIQLGSTTTGILELSSLYVNYRSIDLLENLSEGTHHVTVYAEQLDGEVDHRIVYFTVSLIPLEVDISSPGNVTYHEDSLDLNYSVNKPSVFEAYSLNSGENVTITGNTTLYNLSNGGHHIEVYAIDEAGATASDSVYFTVFVDKTPPVTSDDAPEGWQASDFNVSLTAYDEVSDIAYTSYRVDDGNWANGTQIAIVEEGNHTIEYYSADSFGNIETIRTTYAALDKTSPLVEISAPANNSYTRGTLEVDGYVFDLNLANASLLIDGVSVSDILPYIWDTTAYPDGAYEISLVAFDLANNKGSANVTIVVDNTRPDINIVSPQEGDYSYTQEIALDFDAIDGGSDIAILSAYLDEVPVINGQVIALSDFSLGEHLFEAVAFDNAGNNITETVVFNVADDVPPISSDDADQLWHKNDININIVAEDEKSSVSEVHYIVNGGGEIVVAGSTAQALIERESDNNIIEYWSIDEWGNEEEHHLIDGIRLDKTKPVTEDDYDGEWHRENIVITLAAIDPRVQETPSDVDEIYYIIYEDGIPQGTKTLSVDGWPVITYEDDDNWLEYWSVDIAGNIEDHIMRKGIRLDKTAPVARLWLDPVRDVYYSDEPLPLEYEAYDPVVDGSPSNEVKFSFDIDGIQVEDPQDISAWVGTQTLTITASDLAGNSASSYVTFNIALHAEINIDPDTLNLKSQGRWITAYIEFPSIYDVMTIDIDTVTLNSSIYAENDPKYDFVTSPVPVDKDGDGIVEFMVKFDRSAVASMLSPADSVSLEVSGEFQGGFFDGTDSIRVIQEGKVVKKTELKVQKRLTHKGSVKSRSEVGVDIDIFTLGADAKSVYLREYIPDGFRYNTPDGVYLNSGLAWDLGDLEPGDKGRIRYTLVFPVVDESTTYEFRTVVEYQTQNELEVLEVITYLTVDPNDVVILKKGPESKRVEKGRGYSHGRMDKRHDSGGGSSPKNKGHGRANGKSDEKGKSGNQGNSDGNNGKGGGDDNSGQGGSSSDNSNRGKGSDKDKGG